MNLPTKVLENALTVTLICAIPAVGQHFFGEWGLGLGVIFVLTTAVGVIHSAFDVED